MFLAIFIEIIFILLFSFHIYQRICVIALICNGNRRASVGGRRSIFEFLTLTIGAFGGVAAGFAQIHDNFAAFFAKCKGFYVSERDNLETVER